MISNIGMSKGDSVADLVAGMGILTRILVERGLVNRLITIAEPDRFARLFDELASYLDRGQCHKVHNLFDCH